MAKGYEHIIDLTHFEEESLALEGKGAVVFDHRNRRFYCARSQRSSTKVIDELVAKFNEICVDGDVNPYKAITFEAKDAKGDVIYHTDCLMSLHGKHAFICLDAIRDLTERAAVVDSITKGAHPLGLIVLSLEQILHMSANAQCITNNKGECCIIQSA